MTTMAEEVLSGLLMSPKQVSSKYFYDAEGSRLFEEITTLDEYYPTRSEVEIMETKAAEIAGKIGPSATIVEYGSGSGLKTRMLLAALDQPKRYAAVEISPAALEASMQALAVEFPDLDACSVQADYTRQFSLPFDADHHKIVYFPGSTIGNFEPDEAREFLNRIHVQVGQQGGLLIGVDLKKDPAMLHAAYNDSRDVTAKFNLNLLSRLNRELDANFRVEAFRHYAYYNPVEGRIEMHLVNTEDHCVSIAGQDIDILDGETVRTEYSYKYTRAEFGALAGEAGFQESAYWVDSNNRFGLFYFEHAA